MPEKFERATSSPAILNLCLKKNHLTTVTSSFSKKHKRLRMFLCMYIKTHSWRFLIAPVEERFLKVLFSSKFLLIIADGRPHRRNKAPYGLDNSGQVT